jgi:hypothetical protein
MSKQDRGVFFNGRKDENGKTIDWGQVYVRSSTATEEIRTTMEQRRAARDVGNGTPIKSALGGG